MVNYCTFHIYFLDSCHSQTTGKQLQDEEDRKPLGVKSLLTPYELYMQNGPNYAILRVFLWSVIRYVYLMIYSISVRYLLLNFKTILDGFPIFIYIFSFILSIQSQMQLFVWIQMWKFLKEVRYNQYKLGIFESYLMALSLLTKEKHVLVFFFLNFPTPGMRRNKHLLECWESLYYCWGSG